MYAIVTKYLGPTDRRGARIKAYAGDDPSQSVTVGYPNDANMGLDAHFRAVRAFIEKRDSCGDTLNGSWIPGPIKGGYCWVRNDGQTFRS